jgi:hypothetical protein
MTFLVKNGPFFSGAAEYPFQTQNTDTQLMVAQKSPPRQPGTVRAQDILSVMVN